MDSRPYRMKNLPASLQWIEVDTAEVIEYKEEKLANVKPVCQLQRVKMDFSKFEEVEKTFKTLAPSAKKILVLTEGVLPYLTETEVQNFASLLNSNQAIHYWIAEYHHPAVYFYLKQNVKQLDMKNAPFQFFPEDWYGFFKKLHWSEKKTVYSGDIAKEFGRKPPMPAFIKLIFRFLPKRIKEDARRRTGFIIFQKD